MSKKDFKETKAAIEAGVKKNKKGEPIKTFSKSTFDQMALAILNEVNYEVEIAKIKNGEMVKEKIKPVEKLRKGFLKNILNSAGFDKHEIEKFLNELVITNADGLYETIAEIIYNYMDAGKKFPLLVKEDLKASISLKEVPETEKEHRNPKGDGSTVKVKTKKHKKVVVKAAAPQWLKTRKK